jgi:hypothetical protein
MRTEDGDEIIEPGEYDLSEGRTLRVWLGGVEGDRELWACSMHDHGPFCRLCQRVDGVLNACLINVIDGQMVCSQRPEDGEFLFQVTRAGFDAVRAMAKEVDNG